VQWRTPIITLNDHASLNNIGKLRASPVQCKTPAPGTTSQQTEPAEVCTTRNGCTLAMTTTSRRLYAAREYESLLTVF
jgi:hypothetical protein